MKIKKTSTITLYDLDLILIAGLVIINCRGFRFLLPESLYYIHIQYYRFFLLYSILVATLIVNRETRSYFRPIMQYIILFIIAFFVPQLLYTRQKYGQSVVDFFSVAERYSYLLWCFPILHFIEKERNIERLLNLITNILFIGYLIVISNGVMANFTGRCLFAPAYLGWRNGLVRILDVSSFTPLVVLFCWDRFLKGDRKKLVSLVVIIFALVYVERTRALMIAIVGSMGMIFLFKRRSNINKIVLWIIFSVIVGFTLFAGLWDTFVSQFSVEKNGVSTINRLAEYSYYYEKFLDNKVFGIGLLSEDNFTDYMRISPKIMNSEDVGIVGLLGSVGLNSIIVFVIPLIRFLVVTVKMYSKKISVNMTFFIGLVSFLFLSAPTLIVVDFQRFPLFVFIFAIIECENYRYGNT